MKKDRVKTKRVAWQTIGWGITRVSNILQWQGQRERSGVYPLDDDAMPLALGIARRLDLPILRGRKDKAVLVAAMVNDEKPAQAAAAFNDCELVALVVTSDFKDVIHAYEQPENTIMVMPWD